MNVQAENLKIQKSAFGNGPNAKKGHIKICSHWLKRFWTGENVPISEMSDKVKNDALILTKPTEIFDNCGVFDKNGDAITRPSENANFQDALTFLEWYGVILLSDFGFIIVDNMAPEGEDWLDNYSELKKLLKDESMLGEKLDDATFKKEFEKMLYCFDSAKRLGSTVTALIFVMGYFIF